MNEKEELLLKNAVAKATDRNNAIQIKSDKHLEDILNIVRRFIQTEKVLCYGGTAVNAVLPRKDRFYNNRLDMPDYDFLSIDAISLADKLSNIYARNSKYKVEAKSGVHFGTYKVFVNFIPIADITQCEPELFANLWKNKVSIGRMNYVPINYMRRAMYLELSRPKGDVSRWGKVAHRLSLLDSNYPIKKKITLKRALLDIPFERHPLLSILFERLRLHITELNLIFFGRFVYMVYRNMINGNLVSNDPYFEVISSNAEASAYSIKDMVRDFDSVKITKHLGIHDYISDRYTITIADIPIVHIYQSDSCYSYNIVRNMRIATPETFLSFYLSFLYVDNHYDTPQNILAISEDVIRLQKKYGISKTGVVRKYTITCQGKQTTQKDIWYKRSSMFNKLKSNSPEYRKWFYKWTKRSDKKKTSKHTRKRH